MGKITLKNVKKSYDNKQYSVKDFNLEIEDGEFIILVGPSGCGKTTTLRMIAGLENITEGEIFIDGKKINDVSPKDRDLAMVFQNYALYPHKTVYDNMASPLKLRKMDKQTIDKKVRDAAKMLEISEYLDRKPAKLSGGQKQRVALGRCIVRSPKAFLMDEPLSNLDAKLRVQMRAEIINLQRTLNKTFIYVTHDQVEAMTMGDKIVVMNDGYIQQADTAAELYNNPVNKFVASFIGSPSMNFLEFMDGNISLNGSNFSVDCHKGIYMGVRPEHIDLVEGKDSVSFEARVDSIEPLGAENYINIHLNDKHAVVRDFDLHDVKIGMNNTFYIEKKHLYFFDKETEKRLML